MLRWNLEQKIHCGKKRYRKESTEKAGTIIPVTCEGEGVWLQKRLRHTRAEKIVANSAKSFRTKNPSRE